MRGQPDTITTATRRAGGVASAMYSLLRVAVVVGVVAASAALALKQRLCVAFALVCYPGS